MFVVECVDDDLACFFESSVGSDAGDGAALDVDVASSQVFDAFECLSFRSNKSLSPFREFLFISD